MMSRPLSIRAGLLLAVLLPAPAALAGPGGAALDLPGVAISDVAQTPFRDGFAQRISVRGDPRGMAEVSVRSGGSGFGSTLSLSKPSRAGITAELLTRFPGEVMRVVTEPRRNANGPVGMALGSECLYAWQWIDLGGRREGARGGGPSLFGASEGGAAASIRIKLCRTATATLSDLARSVERMRFTASPAGAPLASEPRVARPRPERVRRPAPNVAAKPTNTAPPAATERPRAARTPEMAAPRASTEAPRYLTPGPGAVPPQPAMPTPAMPTPAASGQGPAPRYITDGTPQAVNPPITAPKPAPNRAEIEDLLARELPARAYRPPP